MIIFYEVALTEIASQQKKYPWQPPDKCLRCEGSTLWGHGFVLRYFNQSPEGIYLKRWRCPACSLIITCRPSTYWRRFQESIKGIFEAIVNRVRRSRWPPWVSRQRGGYWLRRLLENAKLHGLMRPTLVETISLYSTKKLVIF